MFVCMSEPVGQAIEDLTQALQIDVPAPSPAELLAYRLNRGDAYYHQDFMLEAIVSLGCVSKLKVDVG